MTVTELDLARRVQVHVPASYDGNTPAPLVVFQDGSGFLDPHDVIRAGDALDALPTTTIGVFVDPGEDRNADYDPCDDRYGTFLADEVLPAVAARWSVTDDPAQRVVCGFSSGGNAAFTAAWFRPDVFGRVVAFVPSFAQMPGGNPYPALIPAVPAKPIRVYLQTAERDLGWDEAEHNWLAQTLRTAAALAEAAYDVRIVVTDGGHDPADAGRLLPEALAWALRAADGAA